MTGNWIEFDKTMGPNKQRVAIVTDSAAALPDSVVTQYNIPVARMEITIGDETLVDDGRLSLTDFYRDLRNLEHIPTTSAPKPAEYLQRFREAGVSADELLCITVSAQLSAAHDAATVAAEIYSSENPGKTVEVLDSNSAASSQALIVTAGIRAAAAGAELQNVLAAAVKVAERVRLIAMLDTLEFIHRSGRVPKLAVWATNLLNIKPVMEYSADKVGALARPRTAQRAIGRLKGEMLSSLEGRRAHVNIIHADAGNSAEALRRWVAENLETEELFVSEFHPFMGAHTGPGLVGASWWAE